jgi:hypothetical protein
VIVITDNTREADDVNKVELLMKDGITRFTLTEFDAGDLDIENTTKNLEVPEAQQGILVFIIRHDKISLRSFA